MTAIKEHPNDLVLKGPRINGFEADILRLSESGYTVEYEIKISRADYSIDQRKFRYERPNDFDRPGKQIFKHHLIASGHHVNEFYYIVPEGLLSVTEIPPYTGLITTPGNTFRIVKAAPVLGEIRREYMYERYKARQ